MNDEPQLIEASKRGSASAFDELIRLYQQTVYNLALRMLADPEAAADAAQETFLSAFRSIAKFRGGSFKSWLLRIATNECYDQLRRQSRRRTSSLDESDPESGEPREYPSLVAEDPVDAVLRAEVSQALSRALSGLPPDQRAVIVMSDILQMSYQEVAEATGCSLGTVKSRLSRARERVRAHLRTNTELFGPIKRP